MIRYEAFKLLVDAYNKGEQINSIEYIREDTGITSAEIEFIIGCLKDSLFYLEAANDMIKTDEDDMTDERRKNITDHLEMAKHHRNLLRGVMPKRKRKRQSIFKKK